MDRIVVFLVGDPDINLYLPLLLGGDNPNYMGNTHGSRKWVPPILVSFHLGYFSTSMIMGERVYGT